MITKEDIDRYRELCDAALPGPWELVQGSHPDGPDPISEHTILVFLNTVVAESGNKTAAFIVASRDIGPRLVNEVERLNILVEELKKQLRQT